VIASAAVIWDQLIGLRGMQFHVETAIALLHRATQETHGTALQGAARVALAEAWDPKQSDESRAASLKVEEARLFAEFDASQTDSVTPILDQFFGHVREVTDAVRRARTRLQAALDGLRLTEAQVACVTQRVWENTIARYHDGDSSPGAPRR
jgi:hypothetical protein